MRRLAGGVAVMTAGRADELAKNYCMTVTSLTSLSATQRISTSKINLPGQKSNWLPTPKGKCILMLRMYWPNEDPPSIIDGTWTPPVVKKSHLT